MKQIILATSILLILLAGKAWAQESGTTLSERQKQTAYTNALLDSAFRYEKLKPTFFHLKTAYEYRGKEIDDLRNALRMSELQSILHEEELARQSSAGRKQRAKKLKTGLIIGSICGILITTILH